jgi:hypothetical protein
MATESPLIHDGSQCQAAANYWNPSTKLFGPGGSGQFLVVYINASRQVTIAAAATQVPYGILQNTPDIGQAADVGIIGVTKAVAGAAITVNAGVVGLMADSNGRLIPWVAGAANWLMGYAIEPAAAANAIFTMYVVPPFKVVT